MKIFSAATVLALGSFVAADPNSIRSGNGGGDKVEVAGFTPAFPSFVKGGEDGEENFWGGNKENGSGCLKDSQCKSGRCSKFLRCEAKLKDGSRCGEDDDCDSNYCSNFFECEPRECDVGTNKPNKCSCGRDTSCESGRCSKGFDCEDKLDSGYMCWEDDDCKSGRCYNKFCRDRANLGDICWDNNDCESGHCSGKGENFSWRHNGICRAQDEACLDPIPFMITNFELSDDQSWGYFSNDPPTKFKFLKNLQVCYKKSEGPEKYRIYGEPISPELFKVYVKDFMATYKYNHVLYSIHGFTTKPLNSYEDASKFLSDYEETNPYLVIPINWSNYHACDAYNYDRDYLAPETGKELATYFDVFKADYSASIVMDGMGNLLFRVFAQHIQAPEQVFQNIFMVAADDSYSIFRDGFETGRDLLGDNNEVDDIGIPVLSLSPSPTPRPTATTPPSSLASGIVPTTPPPSLPSGILPTTPPPSLASGIVPTTAPVAPTLPPACASLTPPDINPDDEKDSYNGGYAITQLANRTHVVYNRNDDTLGDYTLGKSHFGYKYMAPYLRELVTFHDFTQTSLKGGYVWAKATENVYIGNKFQKGESLPVKIENGMDCVDNTECQNNYCSANDKRCEYGPSPSNTNQIGHVWDNHNPVVVA